MKQLTININNNDVALLREAQYNLCVAKKIAEEAYDVVWVAIPHSELGAVTTVVWKPLYQLWTTQGFYPGATPSSIAGRVDLRAGQQVTFDERGEFSAPVPGREGMLTILDQAGSIYPVVSQLISVKEGADTYLPTFVSSAALLKGVIELAPEEKVLVWFQQRATQGMMFAPPPSASPEVGEEARTAAIEVDFAWDETSGAVTYAHQVWTR